MTKIYTKQCVCSCFNGSFKVSTDQLSEDVSKCSKDLSQSIWHLMPRLNFECIIPSTLSWLSDPYISFIFPGVESMSQCCSNFRIEETIKKRYEKALKPSKKEEEEKSEEKMYISNMLKWSKDSDKNFIKFV